MKVFVAVLCLPLLQLVYSWSVTIDSHNCPPDSPTTCTIADGSCCDSLDSFISLSSRLPKKNVSVNIVSSELVLKKIFTLQNVTNFTLQGYEVQAIVICENDDGVGFKFINVSGLVLRDITIERCGLYANLNLDPGNKHPYSFYALLTIKSSNIVVTNVIVSNSSGYGMMLMNTEGEVSIQYCEFSNNGRLSQQKKGGSSGLGIIVNDYTGRHYNYSAKYSITHCSFIGNTANINSLHAWRYLGSHGGGMFVFLANGAKGNNLTVTRCIYKNNKALLGAGLYIICSRYCIGNTIAFNHSIFEQNRALEGGGAMDIGYSIHDKQCDCNPRIDYNQIPKSNLMHFINCMIHNNSGKFGGGVGIFSGDTRQLAPQHNDKQNEIRFVSSYFIKNRANGGAAVDINFASIKCSYFFMTLNYFIDCSFIKNRAGNQSSNSSSKITQAGTFFTSKIYAYFEGKINFEDNYGTALYVAGTSVKFNNTNITFNGNTGEPSGGILLVGSQSYLELSGNNTLAFGNNKGAFGGAISSLILQTHYFQYTDNCFINTTPNSNTVFNFINNSASTGIAHDIFVTNIKPCNYSANWDNSSCSNPLFEGNCKVAFNFNSLNNKSRYATATEKIQLNRTHLNPIPGIPIELGITQRDQFNQDVSRLFPLSATIPNSDKITIDNSYAFVTENTVIMNGNPHDNATLTLQTNIIAIVMISIDVKMSMCPPGFVLNDTTKSCTCNQDRFIGYCTRNSAALKQGNWAGYTKNNDLVFSAGNCEYRLCQFNRSLLSFGSYKLPTDPQKLERFVCGNRQGRLCGECLPNKTVYYNSPTFRCGNVTDLCKYGLVFYFLSEIVPVTILFLVIIIFNIHLTSGSLYSFMFFAQTLDILYVDAFGSIQFKGTTKMIYSILKTIYSLTNLKFFETETMSFCLFKDTTVMGVFIAQYIPLVYALLLIFATLLILKVNSLYTCIKLCHKCGRRNIRGSVINGLTAFIVLCYFKCVDLTYSILIPVSIFVDGKINKTVPLFNGELDYMKGKHLKYVIPAFICLIVIILPPPVLLLFESVTMTINRSCRIRRNCFTYFLHRIRMKAMPFLDSFQGCFKDSRRCFAGLFFMYKMILLSPYIFTSSIFNDFVSVEVILCAILALHIYFRPFQKLWQNVLDTILMLNLILINLITITHYSTTILINEFAFRRINTFFTGLQIICIALPILCVFVLAIYKINARYNLHGLVWNKLSMKNRQPPKIVSQVFTAFDSEDMSSSESLPFRLVNSENYESFSQ